MHLYLNEREIKILRALEPGRCRDVASLASELELHPQGVRSALGELRRRQLIERAGWSGAILWGDHRITPHGREALGELRRLVATQLRIV